MKCLGLVVNALLFASLALGQAVLPSLGSSQGAGGNVIAVDATTHGCTGGNSGSVATISCTPSIAIAAGHIVVGAVNVGSTSTGVTCTDSNTNALTLGTGVTNGSTLIPFSYTAPANATSITCNWTGVTTLAAIAYQTYSSVGSINMALAGATASGTSTTPSATVTTETNNDWIVGVMASTSIQTITTTTGTQRQQSTTNMRITLADNGPITPAGSATIAGSMGGSAAWREVIIELKP